MKNGFWYFQQATFTDGGKLTKAELNWAKVSYKDIPFAFCLAPLNSCCIFDKTVITYGGEDFTDELVAR